MRQTLGFNEEWLFYHGDCGEYAENTHDDCKWQQVRLPHDWSTQYELSKEAPTGGGGGYVTAGVGWYRKHFDFYAKNAEEKIFLLFEGVYMDSTVYLNGQKVGGREFGYASFQVDITKDLQDGENLLAVRVDNSHQPNSRWYTGSGIYRNVWLIRTDAVHVDVWGVRCHTNGLYLEHNEASLQISTIVQNEGSEKTYPAITHELFDAEGNFVSVSSTVLGLDIGEKGECVVRPTVQNPILWTDENPYLYTLITIVKVDGEEVDRVSNRIGIRTATFDCDKGFLLNDKQVKIKGMCIHHDCGLAGAVGYEEIWRRRLSALKDMGCNGIRCAHNPPDITFLNLCDELGFLVMDEIYDEWMLGKNKNENYYSEAFSYGVNQFFSRCAEQELVTMIHRDYNHPSVILWSVGNEIPEQSSVDGVKILRFLQDICHREDSSRMVTSACDNIAAVETSRTMREFENELDVVGYNYVGRWRERAETFYEEDRIAYPKRRIIGSENPSVGGFRGVYEEKGFWGSYQNATMHHEALWRYTVSHDFVAGDYLWTGIDYLGETRWPMRGAPCGPLDTAGFPKDSYYYFKSIWNQKEITLHLLPHWNWQGEEGTFKQVICYTNCDEVYLYINGRLVGRRAYSCPRYGAKNAWHEGRHNNTTNDLHLSWDVPYEPGELKAEGYKNGELVAVQIVETTGNAVSLAAHTETDALQKYDIVQIEISAVDVKGRFVQDASPKVTCKLQGPAHLIGMDAGDLKDLSAYYNVSRDMLSGRLLAVIQADAPGRVVVTFEAEGMDSAQVEFMVS